MKSFILIVIFVTMALGITLTFCKSEHNMHVFADHMPLIDTAEMRKVQESIMDFVPREWTADPDMIRELSTDVPDSSEIRWSHDHRHYYKLSPSPIIDWYNFSDFPLPEKIVTERLVFPVNSVLKSLSDQPACRLSDPLDRFVRKALKVVRDIDDLELPPFELKRHYLLYGKLSSEIAKDIDNFLIIENITSLSWGSSYNLWLFNVKADKLVSCVILGHYKNKIYRLQKGLFIEQCGIVVPGVGSQENRKELDSLGLRKNEITYNIVRINEEGLVVW